MKLRERHKRILSLLLGMALVFTMNTPIFAAEELAGAGAEEAGAYIEEGFDAEQAEEVPMEAVKAEEDTEELPIAPEDELTGDEVAGAEEDEEIGLAQEEDAYAALAEKDAVVSGNVTVSLSDDLIEDMWLQPDNDGKDYGALSENDVWKVIMRVAKFTTNDGSWYCVSDNEGWYITDFKGHRQNIKSLSDNVIIKYYEHGTDTEIKPQKGKLYGDNIKGNQMIDFTVKYKGKDGQNKDVESATARGSFFVHVLYSGSVSHDYIELEKVTYDGQQLPCYLEVEYDAAVEYRATRIKTTNHYLGMGSYTGSEVSGEVDGAVGVAARIVVLSNNKYVPIDGSTDGNYLWIDQSGLVIKKGAVKNNKLVASRYDGEKAPYFMLKASITKSTGNGLSLEARRKVVTELRTHKFYFTIEPVKIATDLMTTKKNEGNKFRIDKLAVSPDQKKITAKIRYQYWKKSNGPMNKRKMKQRKQLKPVKKNKLTNTFIYDKNGNYKGDFTWEVSGNSINIYGVNGYYGKALGL
ncbi:MAG: hypothetical protein J6O55_07695 [Lachnospiraceae bacterium]|nr:hypothetical protein [Lachnospiraceae bacterium]